MSELTINAVKRLACGKVLHSKHRHDFRMCRCDNETFVDGGLDYQRVGGKDLSKVAVYRDGEYVSVYDG